MIVLHAYTVLGIIYVRAYVPPHVPPVGEPMPESRLLGGAERLPGAEGAGSALLDCVEELVEQLHREGRDVQAVLDA